MNKLKMFFLFFLVLSFKSFYGMELGVQNGKQEVALTEVENSIATNLINLRIKTPYIINFLAAECQNQTIQNQSNTIKRITTKLVEIKYDNIESENDLLLANASTLVLKITQDRDYHNYLIIPNQIDYLFKKIKSTIKTDDFIIRHIVAKGINENNLFQGKKWREMLYPNYSTNVPDLTWKNKFVNSFKNFFTKKTIAKTASIGVFAGIGYFAYSYWNR
ncbi:MAG: hypothetical protein WDZ41_00235 [Candidatus Babeliales bacterium]